MGFKINQLLYTKPTCTYKEKVGLHSAQTLKKPLTQIVLSSFHNFFLEKRFIDNVPLQKIVEIRYSCPKPVKIFEKLTKSIKVYVLNTIL